MRHFLHKKPKDKKEQEDKLLLSPREEKVVKLDKDKKSKKPKDAKPREKDLKKKNSRKAEKGSTLVTESRSDELKAKPVDPNAPKIFGEGGATLQQLLDYERNKFPNINIEVPLVIQRSLDFLMEKGLNAEGLFRVPGSQTQMDYYEVEFNSGRGESIDFLKISETPENVASLLKKYLRDMPDKPLFTSELQDEFMSIMDNEDEDARVEMYLNLLPKIPEVNRCLVKKILFYLMQVASNASTNRMSTDALSIVFGQMAGVFAKNGYDLVKWLIEKYPLVYERTDMINAKSPIFLRKLVGHTRTVFALIKYKNEFLFSFDGNGLCRIWDAVNYQFVKSFSTKCKFPSNSTPVISDEKLMAIEDNNIYTWEISELLDPLNENPEGKKIPFEVENQQVWLNCAFTVGSDVWLCGNCVIIYHNDGSHEVIVPVNQDFIGHVSFIDGNAWMVCEKGKLIQVWDVQNRTIITSFGGPELFGRGKPTNLLEVGDQVWIAGSEGAFGVIWVITKEGNLVKVLQKHKGEIYALMEIGPFIWSVSWDCMIFTWDKKTQEYVTNILNFHRDAIQTLLPVPRSENDGWIVWTGSSDRTINVMFVPTEYTEELHQQGLIEKEKEEARRLEQQRLEELKEEEQRKEAERKRDLKASEGSRSDSIRYLPKTMIESSSVLRGETKAVTIVAPPSSTSTNTSAESSFSSPRDLRDVYPKRTSKARMGASRIKSDPLITESDMEGAENDESEEQKAEKDREDSDLDSSRNITTSESRVSNSDSRVTNSESSPNVLREKLTPFVSFTARLKEPQDISMSDCDEDRFHKPARSASVSPRVRVKGEIEEGRAVSMKKHTVTRGSQPSSVRERVRDETRDHMRSKSDETGGSKKVRSKDKSTSDERDESTNVIGLNTVGVVIERIELPKSKSPIFDLGGSKSPKSPRFELARQAYVEPTQAKVEEDSLLFPGLTPRSTSRRHRSASSEMNRSLSAKSSPRPRSNSVGTNETCHEITLKSEESHELDRIDDADAPEIEGETNETIEKGAEANDVESQESVKVEIRGAEGTEEIKEQDTKETEGIEGTKAIEAMEGIEGIEGTEEIKEQETQETEETKETELTKETEVTKETEKMDAQTEEGCEKNEEGIDNSISEENNQDTIPIVAGTEHEILNEAY
eukprot:TRINITY_DN3665_c0_g3_i2.p1 TRINITY_DN3665_c0_g3~~TRINITY_DN3665_c0_g3_i2.p1  ORF type:complete len:1154 (-),score=276.80 TRINITY_DN3665_c0_g3_i2:120-3581(-)